MKKDIIIIVIGWLFVDIQTESLFILNHESMHFLPQKDEERQWLQKRRFVQLSESALKMGQVGITALNHLKTHLSFLLISCHTQQCLCFQ